jgi:hypothetical protein
LKLIDWPTLTLKGSAKPSMVSPSFGPTSQADCGVPGSWFSHAIGLVHDEGACAAACDTDALGEGDGEGDTVGEGLALGDGDALGDGAVGDADAAGAPAVRAHARATATGAATTLICRLQARPLMRVIAVLDPGRAGTLLTYLPP